ncbi:MAG: MobA/MobL family protein [Alphaproteobacteria bacterium]
MAIYSCNLSSIGKTTHREGTAGAHIRYIARSEAEPVIIAAHMPAQPAEARNWIDRAERAARKNARMLDKIRIALPRELDAAQRAQLVRDFMDDLTGGERVPWFAAIHQTGDDAHNPHVHIDVHDRGIDTGRRVLRLSDSTRDRIKAGLPGPKAVDWIRERWEAVCNSALEAAGHDARIDRRTLKGQGIDRLPTIHEGPRASHINDNVSRPKSRRRTNGCGRVIDYPAIDKGQTRREFNAHIIDLNLERAIRSGNPEAAAWAAFERDQADKDRALEKQLKADQRARTQELRSASAVYTAQQRRVRAEQRLKARQNRKDVQERFQARRESMRGAHDEQHQALRRKQRGLLARIARRLSRNVRARHMETRVRQIEAHREERRLLSEAYALALAQTRDALTERYAGQYEEIEAARTAHLGQLEERHAEAVRFADVLRQQREAEREQHRALTENKIAEWKRAHNKQQQPASRLREDFKQADGREQARRDAIARAIKKVEGKEDDERKRGPGGGRDR